MSRIFALKKAITLGQAATHLSNVANDPVTEVDLLELALQGELTISLSLSGKYSAAPYTEGAPQKAHEIYAKLNSQQGTLEYTKLLIAFVDYTGFCLHWHDGKTDKLGPDFMEGLPVSGIWDLSMLGVERELVEGLLAAHQSSAATFTGNGRIENLKPLLLRHMTETNLLVGLFTSEDEPDEEGSDLDNIECREELINLLQLGFIERALQHFPHGSTLVVRTENLQKFINKITESPETDSHEAAANDKQNAARAATDDDSEIARLQRTVAGLALGLMREYPKYRYGDKPNISKLTDLATDHLRSEHGDRPPHGFGKSTISDAIKAALERYRDLNE
jgi:hypothetical protein